MNARDRDRSNDQPGSGSIVWRVVNGVQVVCGPDYERNSHRDKRAVARVGRTINECDRMYRDLLAGGGIDEAERPLRQLSLFEEVA